MFRIAASISIQIEIRMVGHVNDSRLIRFCLVANINGIIIRQCHQHLAGNITGKSFFTIFGKIGQLKLLRTNLPGIIYLVLESLWTAMQAMSVVVARQNIFHTIQHESSLIDTIGITPDRSSEVRRYRNIILYRIKPKNYIPHNSLFIGYHNRNNTSAEIRHTYFHVVSIAKYIQISLFTIHFGLEIALQ